MLDELIYNELLSIRDEALANYQSIETDIKRWLRSKGNISSKIAELNRTLKQRMTDQQDILLERIRGRIDRRRYLQPDELLLQCAQRRR